MSKAALHKPCEYWSVNTFLDVWEYKAGLRFKEAVAKTGVTARVQAEAARQIILAVHNLRVLLAVDLHKLTRDLSFDRYPFFNQLETFITESKNHSVVHFTDEMRISRWITQLPFEKHIPRVTGISKRFFIPTSQVAQIHFIGVFPNARNFKYRPTLDMEGIKTTLIREDQSQLEFSFTLWPPHATEKTFKAATLKIPYETGYVRTCIEIATYRLQLCALSLSAGKVEVQYAKKDQASDVQSLSVTQQVKIEKVDELQPWIKKEATFTCGPGRFIVPWSAWCIEGFYPDTTKDVFHRSRISKIDNTSITVETELATQGTSIPKGCIIRYDTSATAITVCQSKKLTPAWNTAVDITPPLGLRIAKIIFDSAEGLHYEFGESIQNHPLLRTTRNYNTSLRAEVYHLTCLTPTDEL